MPLMNGNISNDLTGLFLFIFCCFAPLVELFAMIMSVTCGRTAKVEDKL